MNMLDDLIAQIRSAWAHASYEGDVESELRSSLLSPDTEAREAAAALLGKAWDEVPESMLLAACPSPFLSGAVAFRYYLPALLIAAIQHPSEMYYELLDHLRRPKKPKAVVHFDSRFGALSPAQKTAVAQFMKYAVENIPEVQADERLVRMTHKALEDYWCPRPATLYSRVDGDANPT